MFIVHSLLIFSFVSFIVLLVVFSNIWFLFAPLFKWSVSLLNYFPIFHIFCSIYMFLVYILFICLLIYLFFFSVINFLLLFFVYQNNIFYLESWWKARFFLCGNQKRNLGYSEKPYSDYLQLFSLTALFECIIYRYGSYIYNASFRSLLCISSKSKSNFVCTLLPQVPTKTNNTSSAYCAHIMLLPYAVNLYIKDKFLP